VNSALFGLRTRVDTIEQAIPILGLTLLRTIILSFHLSRHKTPQKSNPVFQRLWRSSLSQAVFAELIAEKIIGPDPPSCFLAGMLQDIGALAMLSEAPDEYIEFVLDRATFPKVVAAERNHFGFSHIDVSLEIVNQWGMSEDFAEAIRHHHDQIAAPQNGRSLKSILQAANLGTIVLLTKQSATVSLNDSLKRWTRFLDEHFGFNRAKAEEIISEVNDRVAEYSILFNFNVGESVEADNVVDAAKDLLQEFALTSQLKQVEQRNKKRSKSVEDDELYRDSLTGLYNRRFINERLSHRIVQHVNKCKPVAVLFLDVDKFKSINDNYGHSAGDKAIKHVASWLTRSTRGNDLAIRLGGDEFLVVLDVADEKTFESVANRIAQIPPMEHSSGKIDVSLSIGATYYQPLRGDFADANWLIDQSDQSMYRAKRSGGGMVSVQSFLGMDAPSASTMGV
jgi:diguanylate cyclase (GGDEF)-like protein